VPRAKGGDIAVYSNLLGFFASHGRLEEIENVLHIMEEQKIPVTPISLAAVVREFAETVQDTELSVRGLRLVISTYRKYELKPEYYIYRALFDVYARKNALRQMDFVINTMLQFKLTPEQSIMEDLAIRFAHEYGFDWNLRWLLKRMWRLKYVVDIHFMLKIFNGFRKTGDLGNMIEYAYVMLTGSTAEQMSDQIYNELKKGLAEYSYDINTIAPRPKPIEKKEEDKKVETQKKS